MTYNRILLIISCKIYMNGVLITQVIVQAAERLTSSPVDTYLSVPHRPWDLGIVDPITLGFRMW